MCLEKLCMVAIILLYYLYFLDLVIHFFNSQLSLECFNWIRIISTWYYFSAINIFIVDIGAYTPLTKEGKILVDDVLASRYAFVDHKVAQIGMIPIQWFPEIVQWLFSEDDGGFSVFAKVLHESALPLGLLS